MPRILGKELSFLKFHVHSAATQVSDISIAEFGMFERTDVCSRFCISCPELSVWARLGNSINSILKNLVLWDFGHNSDLLMKTTRNT